MLFETLLRVTHVCGGCLLGSGALGLSRVGQLAGEGGRGRGGRMSWWETRGFLAGWGRMIGLWEGLPCGCGILFSMGVCETFLFSCVCCVLMERVKTYQGAGYLSAAVL